MATQVLGYGLGAYLMSWAVLGRLWGLWGLLTDCAAKTILECSQSPQEKKSCIQPFAQNPTKSHRQRKG